jgi:hypothetical protein
MAVLPLPFLTLPDPAVSGEGILDPLGLATTGDRLANWILPGLTARMSRPRFLTAIAVSATVCDGLEEATAVDGVTPPHIIFEWLLVEAFARQGTYTEILRTPGIEKARSVINARLRMSAKAYLKNPTVFGFHGVYKRLAVNLNIVDDDLRLADNGYSLIKQWEIEQGLNGFLDTSVSRASSTGLRQILRSAVEEALRAGYTDRSASWQGWRLLTEHLAPGSIGVREAGFIRHLLLDDRGDMRREVFELIEKPQNLSFADRESEAALVRHILTQTSADLAHRLETIIAYEDVCAMIEDAFDWLRYASSQAGARALHRSEFASINEVQDIVRELPRRLSVAHQAMDSAPLQSQIEFARLVDFLNHVSGAEDLFDALLDRHAQIQRAKMPEGKREWFERAADGGVFVRTAYGLEQKPEPRDWWRRPYRLQAVRSFCHDLMMNSERQ